MRIRESYIEEDQISDEEAGFLNMNTEWTDPPRDLCIVASELLGKIYRIYLNHLKSPEGSVNWSNISRNSKEFRR